MVSGKKVFILDSTAFYAGIPPDDRVVSYTTEKVLSEVSHNPIQRIRIETLIDSGSLKILNPGSQAMKDVMKLAKESGDNVKLSETDYSVVALALHVKMSGLDAVLVTDDFSMQNLSTFAGLDTSSVITKGIKKVIRWRLYCPGCGKHFEGRRLTRCDNCGTDLKLKPSKA